MSCEKKSRKGEQQQQQEPLPFGTRLSVRLWGLAIEFLDFIERSTVMRVSKQWNLGMCWPALTSRLWTRIHLVGEAHARTCVPYRSNPAYRWGIGIRLQYWMRFAEQQGCVVQLLDLSYAHWIDRHLLHFIASRWEASKKTYPAEIRITYVETTPELVDAMRFSIQHYALYVAEECKVGPLWCVSPELLNLPPEALSLTTTTSKTVRQLNFNDDNSSFSVHFPDSILKSKYAYPNGMRALATASINGEEWTIDVHLPYSSWGPSRAQCTWRCAG